MAWHDQSIVPYHVDDAVTSDPSYVAESINFNPAIDFDGDDYMSWDETNVPWFEGDMQLTMFSVVESDDAAGYRGWIDTENSSDSDGGLYMRFVSGQTTIGASAQGGSSKYFDDDGVGGNALELRSTAPLIV